MKKLEVYSNKLFLLFISVCCFSIVFAQQTGTIEWKDIFMDDTLAYASTGVPEIFNEKYPPSNLFDINFKTCWVAGVDKDINNPSILIELPDLEEIVINIFSGYGKNKNLYYANSRPRKLQFSVYEAINPEAYVTEYGASYKAAEYPHKQIVNIPDSCGVHSFKLDFLYEELSKFRKKVNEQYDSDFQVPKAKSCLALHIKILETWPGTKYDDICISEIFFNDCLVSPISTKGNKKIYLNADENALLLDDSSNKGVVIYHDTSSVLQLLEVSDNKKWAVLISMPAEIEGRTETTYLLVDLVNKKVVNSQLEKITGNYISGNELYFENGKYGQLYLVYSDKDFDYHKIELR